MADEKETWGDYSKLVLRELERLNDNHEKMRSDFDNRLNELSSKLNDVKGIEKGLLVNTTWMDKVNEVWSPTQMKEAKDEIYKQKSLVTSAIAIISFIQIAIGIIVSIWVKLSH